MVFMIQYLVIFTQTYSFQDSDGNEKFFMLPVLKNHILIGYHLNKGISTTVIFKIVLQPYLNTTTLRRFVAYTLHQISLEWSYSGL
jgi:hypothetical protein